MYQAIIARIKNIRPHGNADRLVLGTVCGEQVIVSKGTPEDTLGVFFQTDGQLSHEYCYNNNLYNKKELNKDTSKAGFFGNNRRVKTQKFRGENSDGFWVELSTLEFTGGDVSILKEGDEFEEFNGIKICNKYMTPATLSGGANRNKNKSSKKGFKPYQFPYFLEHWDTAHLGRCIHTIPEGALLSITEKLHGTSGRTGRTLRKYNLRGFKKLWNNTIGKIGPKFTEEDWFYITGTRRVVLDSAKTIDTGFYSGKTFRMDLHRYIKSIGLHKGETIYYEIVGFDEQGGAIMGQHGISKELIKKAGLAEKDYDALIAKYGNTFCYSYGCAPCQYKIYVYRITQTSDDGHPVELSIQQVINRCSELGLNYVPVIKGTFIYDGNQDSLLNLCIELAEQDEILDRAHPREGIVLRVEAPGMDKHFKVKSFVFRLLEGMIKEQDNYIDEEEIS